MLRNVVNKPNSAIDSRRVRKQRRIVAALLNWFCVHARDLPWRHTRDPYAIWISEVMLQQTQVKTVVPYWERWMRELPDVRSLACASLQQVLRLWEGLGYYTRARNLHLAARFLNEQMGSNFPQELKAILALPGVGRYTAGAICSIAFNQPTPILDGNITRVLTRLFGIRFTGSRRAELWALAESLVSQAAGFGPRNQRNCSNLNQALMELGALICTSRQPKCLHCPVRRCCVAFQDDCISTFSQPVRSIALTAKHFVAFVVEHRRHFLVRQRPAGVLNGRLWEFPSVEVKRRDKDVRKLVERVLDTAALSVKHLLTLQHTITRYRIKLEVFRIVVPPGIDPTSLKGIWRTRRLLQRLPFSKAHRRIADKLSG